MELKKNIGMEIYKIRISKYRNFVINANIGIILLLVWWLYYFDDILMKYIQTDPI